jgi:2,3-bisphosphoglycerate-independent phosphoglycerate mutase
MNTAKVLLIIMDGWGLGKIKTSDAIQNANVPFVSSLYSKYPNSTLITCGELVGLPEGQMGNSEVGHLNIGAGPHCLPGTAAYKRCCERWFISTKSSVLLETLNYAKTNKKDLHLIGL